MLDAPHLFDRPGGLYGDASGADWSDNWARFGALAKAAVLTASGAISGYRPDLLHVHDWQAALAPAFLHYEGIGVPSVITIHNIAFQGRFPATTLETLGLPSAALAMDGVEYYGGIAS